MGISLTLDPAKGAAGQGGVAHGATGAAAVLRKASVVASPEFLLQPAGSSAKAGPAEGCSTSPTPQETPEFIRAAAHASTVGNPRSISPLEGPQPVSGPAGGSMAAGAAAGAAGKIVLAGGRQAPARAVCSSWALNGWTPPSALGAAWLANQNQPEELSQEKLVIRPASASPGYAGESLTETLTFHTRHRVMQKTH